MQAARGTSLTHGDSTPHTDDSGAPARPRRGRFRLVFALVAITFWAVDQLTKLWAVEALTDRGRVDVVGDLFGWRLAYNPGAAFSTGTQFTELFSVLAIVATVVVLWLSRRLGSMLWAVGLGLLLAGITGNLTDRLFRAPGVLQGHVVDFMELPNWPIFNVADICLDAGIVIILIQSFRSVRLDGTRHEGGR